MANATQKVITIESTIWERHGIAHTETGKEWSLWLNGYTTLRDIEEFYEVAGNIFKDCIKAHKKGNAYQVQIYSIVDYDDSTTKMDLWVSDSWYNQDGEGIHLLPDERYTESYRDIYLTKNVRKDLVSYVI